MYKTRMVLAHMDEYLCTLVLDKFQAIIGEDNEKSINMFKKIKFVQISEPNYFREISLDCEIDDEWKKWIMSKNVGYSIECYR